jgi:hypothetical protein
MYCKARARAQLQRIALRSIHATGFSKGGAIDDASWLFTIFLKHNIFILVYSHRKRIPHHRTNGVVGEELFSRLKGVHQQHVSVFFSYCFNLFSKTPCNFFAKMEFNRYASLQIKNTVQHFWFVVA